MKRVGILKRLMAFMLAVAIIMSFDIAVLATNTDVYIPEDNSVKITDVICTADETRSGIYNINVKGEFNSATNKNKVDVTMLTYVKGDNALSVTDKGYDEYQDNGDMQIVGIDMIERRGTDKTFDFLFTVSTDEQNGSIYINPGQAAIVLVGGDGLNPGAALFKIDTDKEQMAAGSISVTYNEVVDVYSYYKEADVLDVLKKSFKTTPATVYDKSGNKLGTTNIVGNYIQSVTKKDETTYTATVKVPASAMTFGDVYDIVIPEEGLETSFDVKANFVPWMADTVSYTFGTSQKIAVGAIISEADIKTFFVGKTVDISLSSAEGAKETVTLTDAMVAPVTGNPTKFEIGNVFNYKITIPDTNIYKVPAAKNDIAVSVEIVDNPPKPFTVTEAELIGEVPTSYTGIAGELKNEVIERVKNELNANSSLKATVKGDGGREETWRVKSGSWSYTEDVDGKSVFAAEIEKESADQYGVNSNNVKVYAKIEINLTKYTFNGDAFTYDFSKVGISEAQSGDITSQYGKIKVERASDGVGGELNTSIDGDALKVEAKRNASGTAHSTITIYPDEFNHYNKKMVTTLKFKTTYTDENGNPIENSKDTSGSACYVDIADLSVKNDGTIVRHAGALYRTGKNWAKGTRAQHGVSNYETVLGQIPTADADGFYSLRLESFKDENGNQRVELYGEGCTEPIVKNIYSRSTESNYADTVGYGVEIAIRFTSLENGVHTVWLKDVDIEYVTDMGIYKFINDDGTVLKKEFVEYKSPIVAPSAPTKVGDAQYGYVFNKWDGYTDGMILENYSYSFKPVFDKVINKYTYKFLNEDGSLILEKTVDYGTEIVPPSDPVKEGNEQYSYIFEGWDGFADGMTITEDVTFKATFSAVANKHIFNGDAFTYDFSKVDSSEAQSGDISSQYGKIKVERASDGTGGELNTSIDGNALKVEAKRNASGTAHSTITIYPDEFNHHNEKMVTTLKFKNTYTDANGNVIENSLDTSGVCFVDIAGLGIKNDGTVVRHAGALYRAGKDWAKGTRGQHGVSNYETVLGQIPAADADGFYSLRLEAFKDENGNHHTQLYGEGCTEPIVKNVYSKSTESNYADIVGYGVEIAIRFTSLENGVQTVWLKDIDIEYVTDMGIYKFINGDGTVLKKEFVEYESPIVAPTSAPTKDRDAQYTYVFYGWDGYTDGMLLENYSYSFKPIFNKIINKYTYKFVDEDGTTIEEKTVDYGTTIVAPTAPVKESDEQYSYTFDGWSGFATGMTISGDVTFTAKYKKVANKYTYKFLNEDGSVIEEKTVDYGTVIEKPSDPVKIGNEQYSYIFDGWDGFADGMTVTKDVTFTAKFSSVVNKYTYKFLNEDGSVIEEKTVDYGTVIEKPSDPVKIDNEQYSYIFDGWDGFADGMTATKDVTFKAKFKAVTNKYTYKFLNEDGSVIEEKTVAYGTVIVAPSNPVKVGNEQYSYIFDGWDGFADGMTVTKDVTFTAKFSAVVNKYTYKFLNEDGSVIEEKTVAYGTVIEKPSDPVKIGNEQYSYIFDGWDGFADGMTVTKDVTFTAKFSSVVNKYTYKFLSEDGSVIAEKTADYGSLIEKPAAPSKEADAQYTYTFERWIGYTDGMTVTKDVTFTAKFSSVVNKYTYKFLNEDGSLIIEKTVDYGTVIEKPSDPVKDGNDQNNYVFVGWEGYTEGMTVTKDVEFKATFSSVTNKYTYKFLNEDGSVIEEKTVDFGTVIVAPSDPVKVGNEQYSYIFDGWEGYTDGMTVTKNVTFKAKFSSVVNKYTYKFLNEDGSVIEEKTVDYGTVIVAPSDPVKESTAEYTYTFAGWEGFADGMTVTGDIEFTAKFSATVNEEPLVVAATKTETGYNFDILINKAKVEEFTDAKFIVAFYDENNRLVKLSVVPASYEDANFDVDVSENVERAKVMLWKGVTPVCKETEVGL